MRDGAVGVDLYNAQVTGEVSVTLRLGSSDADHVPCVIAPMASASTQTWAFRSSRTARTQSTTGHARGTRTE